MNSRIVPVFIALLAAAAAPAQERALVFQNGLGGYAGCEDCYVQSGRPDRNTNYKNHPDGNLYEFEWDGLDAGGRNYALIKFGGIVGEEPGQIPPGARIVEAVLETTVSNDGSAGDFSSIYNLLAEWNQETATFHEVFPGLPETEEPGIGDFLSETSVLAPHNPNRAGEAWRVDIAPLIQEIVDGLPNNGMVVIPSDNVTNGFGHYSSETPLSDPDLSLTVETANAAYTFKDGENGYRGLRDAWIGNNGDRYVSNYGGGELVEVERNAIDDVRLGLIRFDGIFGSGGEFVPPGADIRRASLNLWVQRGSDRPVLVSEILPFEKEVLGVTVNTRFNERAVTYENFVEDGVYPQSGHEIAASSVARFVPESFTRAEIDVTESVRRWAGGAENLGWVLEASGNELVEIAAKEGGAGIGPPKLTVTFIAETSVSSFAAHE